MNYWFDLIRLCLNFDEMGMWHLYFDACALPMILVLNLPLSLLVILPLSRVMIVVMTLPTIYPQSTHNLDLKLPTTLLINLLAILNRIDND